jgi:hypothetical protein
MEMKRIVISNAMSLNMLKQGNAVIKVREVSLSDVKELLNSFDDSHIMSVVGHAGTSMVLTTLLGRNIPVNRVEYKIEDYDVVIVFQVGVRLSEGSVLSADEVMKLPVKFFVVEVTY